MKRIVIGITAHVDSGKTTLSEAMLYRSGNIRNLGRVDHKDAFLDNSELERERGITIFSKQAVFSWNNTSFTLLDTPGHVDFSAETERTLKVLDYAVLVISASEGVQSHTETIWKLLTDYRVPVFVFINKTDISERSEAEILSELKSKLGEGFVDFTQEPDGDELAMCDEDIMEEYLSGNISEGSIQSAILSRKLFPCVFGSALKVTGIDEFLSVLDSYTSTRKTSVSFGARVYKITFDEQGKRLTHMRITGGSIKVRDMISGKNINGELWEEKINQLRIYNGGKFSQEDEVKSGSVCAVVGLTQTYPGEGLGAEEDENTLLLEPVFSYRVILPDGFDVHKALVMLRRLEEEDPTLRIEWNEQLSEIRIRLMGEIQLEVLKRIIHDRFDLDVTFGKGGISYKETIKEPVRGIGHYEPLRHYAEVHLLLEPGKKGSGVVITSDCSEDVLEKNWQRLILTHLSEKSHIGVLTGSPVTDIKISLIAGRAHLKHTEGGDFRQATYRAVRQGLKSAENILLEPWYRFTLRVPAENTGRAMTDVQQMGGTFSAPETDGEYSVIKGTAPVSEINEYHSEVTGYTKGRGRLTCVFDGYEPCHNADEVIRLCGYDSDADMENTADSVFCSHGAGFVVKWDKVPDYAHVESEFFEDAEDKEVRVREYIRSIATDEELLRIFEQTYGPVKRVLHTALETRKKTVNEKKPKPVKIIRGDEYLLIDGYNIIFAWDELKNLAKDNLDMARNRLIDIVCNYQGYKKINVILVFDAYKVKGNRGEVERIHDVDIVYTKEAETADMYIEKVTHQLGKNNRVRVATSDNLEQLIILAGGAIRVSAEAFKKEIDATEKEICDFLKMQTARD